MQPRKRRNRILVSFTRLWRMWFVPRTRVLRDHLGELG